MGISSVILNEDFTGINQNTFNNYLKVYEQLLDLVPSNFYEHIQLEDPKKNLKPINKEEVLQSNITNTKFNSLTRNISNKYFGVWRQEVFENQNVGAEKKPNNYGIKAEKEFNIENVFKKRFLFWIINNYENQRVPNLNTVNQEPTL
ncbi:uncharacterized protein cubi_02748 [Cryptosporidium ubiquitum]|uniref:Uncharacterized protein n=1 Tax=Cryptosporidium ubiquitum TaxID=857276 RepID=A0A1J4MI64_9CRYT|nr:uncharacterized protein cubi_02748 [Cryptosporidium ubiquitum]OII73946.1 hypothetical protein cubi_02748 [Cryptosporidium ubiquitum]